MNHDDTVEAIARRSYGKLVAFLAVRTSDVAAAEDALSDAFVAALADWPAHGCPSNPEAWLLTVARRKLIDAQRKLRSGEGAKDQLRFLAEGLDAAAADPEIPDRRLALLFACAHPSLEAGIRAPLMLQAVVGLDAKTDRLRLPYVSGGHGQAARAGQKQDPRSRYPVSHSGD